MRSLQKTPEKIRSFFQKPSLQYPRECRGIYGLINTPS
jgi:hypothetical protein